MQPPRSTALVSLHAQHSTHPSSIVSEEDSAKSCKCTDEIGSNSDWGFDASDISSTVKDNVLVATHDG